MASTDEYQKWVASFKKALLKIEPEINEGQRKMLLGHYGAPDRALSVKRLAEIAGYKGDRAGSLQYGKLARKISEAIGEPPVGDLISMIAEWRGGLKDGRGHGQWILYGEVAQALEELGWITKRAESETIRSNPQGEPIELPAATGKISPEKKLTEVERTERDAGVKNWVLNQAKGRCECCNQNAPFTLNDGSPYLEVHHVHHLANGGSDTPANAVAVCPNCHRELHHGKDKEELVRNLYACIARLRRE